MKKILVVDFNGTSSIYTHYLSKGLKDEEDQLKILGKEKPEFLDVFENLNEYLGYKTKFKLLNYILNWHFLLVNYKKFDVIVIQWLQLLKYISIEIKLINYLQSRVKLIYIVHNLYPHNTKNKKIVKRYNKLYKISKNISVHTSKINKNISELSPEANILRFEHGFFFKEFRQKGIKIISNKCLMIGYISKYKGIEDALEVVKILKGKDIIIYLEIIGLATPEYLNVLTKLIHNFNINGQVTILSEEVSTRFLISKINESTMLWLPYKNISQSGVAYTSIGLGKPFVGYDVGNFKECFGDVGVAKIVKQDSVEDFSEAVIQVLENEDFYRKNIEKLSSQNLWNSNKTILDLNFKS
jgi:glycosyltransferase involved in cell wall biosynthesis